MSIWLLPVVLSLGGLVVFGVVLLARQMEGGSWRRSLTAYRLRLASDLSVDDVAAWLSTVNAATHAPLFSLLPAPPIALELVASKHGIEHVLLVSETMQGVMLANLRSSLPGVRVERLPDYLTNNRPRCQMAAEAVITNHARPLAHDRAAVASATILGSLQPLYGNEQVVIQWIVTGGGIPKPIASVSANSQQSNNAGWFVDSHVSADSEAVRAARAKQQTPLLRCSLRVGVVANDRKRAVSIFGKVWASFRILNAPGVGIVRRWWLPVGWVADRMQALHVPLFVWPLTLNTRELAGVIGFPVGGLHLPGVSTGAARQLPTPSSVAWSGAVLGASNYPGSENRSVALRRDDRLRHVWAIGPTGSGKSTLLANLIRHDIDSGSGLVVIDARGDLITDVLARV